jgi:hypothetical protein
MAVRETRNGNYVLIDLISGKAITEIMSFEKMDTLVKALRDGSYDGIVRTVFDW